MALNKMILTLSDKLNNTIQIEFQVRETLSAQIWAKSIEEAGAFGLRESDRFYNFPQQDRSNLEHLLISLKDNIKKLSSLHPEITFPKIDLNHLQESINDLHFNFAHGHHVTKNISELNEKYWGTFNTTLHNIEAVLSNDYSVKHTGLSNARIVFTWNKAYPTIIPNESYSDFSVNYEFGTVYANYSQVGRHFYEMFRSQDDQLADEHIQPSRFISADTNIWLGPTSGHAFEQKSNEQIKNWFENRKERFNRLGYFWGDPQLAIGQIPVARIAEPLVSIREIKSYVDKLSNFSKVLNVKVG